MSPYIVRNLELSNVEAEELPQNFSMAGGSRLPPFPCLYFRMGHKHTRTSTRFL